MNADQVAAAQADADRKIREAHGHLNRVLGELLRRGVAVDLVPDWWRTAAPELVADAEMRAGWSERDAAAARIRDLEEALHAAEEQAADERRRRRSAEHSARSWQEIAASVPDGCRHLHVSAEQKVAGAARERQAWEVRAERHGEEARRWRHERAEPLAAFVRRVPRLPEPVSKIPYGEVFALAWAVAPAQGLPVALPAATVSEICRRAVAQWADDLRFQQRVPGQNLVPARLDVDEAEARTLARLLAAPPESAVAAGQGDLFDGGAS